jgi:hypothetical protein
MGNIEQSTGASFATLKIGYGLAVLLFTMVAPLSAFAVAHGSCIESNCNLFLTGRIAQDDVQLFRQSFEKMSGKGSLFLSLDSEGGDIASAIEIGRLVRRWPESIVLVTLSSKCYSACVFVLAGGLHRAVHGKVGIHRPFGSSTDARTYESTQKSFRTLEQSAKAFLKDMNVPTSLFDEMMSVPSQQLRLLSQQELARFGIGQSDPAYQDNRDADAARMLGLDREEYLRRKGRAEKICNALTVNERKAGIEVTLTESAEIFIACKDAVVRARPLTEAQKRALKGAQSK